METNRRSLHGRVGIDWRLKLLMIVWAVSIQGSAYAQRFNYSARLGAVTVTGFYKIPVSAELSAVAQLSLADVRISDGGNFVPYVVEKNEGRVQRRESFAEMPIIDTRTDTACTTVVISNTTTGGLSRISLILKNTGVQRYASLSGSDDNRNWSIISENIPLQNSGGLDDTTGYYTQTVAFPLSKFRYFKLRIDNAHTDPLKIVQAGVFHDTDTRIAADEAANPAPRIMQKDSGKYSYILIRNNAPYALSKVSVDFTGPKFFRRRAVIYFLEDDHDSSGLEYQAGAGEQEVVSGSGQPVPVVFNVQARKAVAAVIYVSNDDNPPLRAVAAATSRHQQYLVSWLEAGKTYTLFAGNDAAETPQYDLSHFKDSIPAHLTAISLGALTKITAPPAAPAKRTNIWLWPALVLAVAVLGFLTFRLARDVRKGG